MSNAENQDLETVEKIKDTEKESETKPTVSDKTKKSKKFNNSDLIPCRSVVQGELVYKSKKTDNLYTWEYYGDITEVEYGDLLSLRGIKSGFLFNPLFIIEDERLLDDPKWKAVQEVYDKMQNEDITYLLSMDNDEFAKILPTLPVGIQNSIKTTVSTYIENGEFDSISKIKTIDEVCGTDLQCLI